MKQWILALIAAFFISGCSTLQVQVDSDPDYDFSSLSKFNVIYTKKDDGNDFSRSRLSKSLTKYFEKKGYTSTDKNKADFYLVFHLDVQKRSELETNYQEMGVNPRRDYYNRRPYATDGRRGMYADRYPMDNMSSVTTTRTYEYEEGRLVVEVLDVKENAVFWQSKAEDELSNSGSQEESTVYIENLLEKMFGQFPKK